MNHIILTPKVRPGAFYLYMVIMYIPVYYHLNRMFRHQPGVAKPKWCKWCKCNHSAGYKHK